MLLELKERVSTFDLSVELINHMQYLLLDMPWC